MTPITVIMPERLPPSERLGGHRVCEHGEDAAGCQGQDEGGGPGLRPEKTE